MKNKVIIVLLGIFVLAGLTAAVVDDVPETITLKGKKKAAVEFPHKAHIDAGYTCKSCHHTLENDTDTPEKGCSACHTADSDVNAMKAFHGNCVDCHKTEKKENKAEVPTKCKECHVKE
jgi:hypothetical protein